MVGASAAGALLHPTKQMALCIIIIIIRKI